MIDPFHRRYYALLMLAVALTACAGVGRYAKPCTIRGLTVHLLSEAGADNYCRAVSLSDSGDVTASRDQILGCYHITHGRAEIAVIERPRTWVHELRHLFDKLCGRMK